MSLEYDRLQKKIDNLQSVNNDLRFEKQKVVANVQQQSQEARARVNTTRADENVNFCDTCSFIDEDFDRSLVPSTSSNPRTQIFSLTTSFPLSRATGAQQPIAAQAQTPSIDNVPG